MRILDVSPSVVFPPYFGGRLVRTYNLLRHLSRSQEIRQFSHVRPRLWPPRREAIEEVWLTPTYCEVRHSSSATGLAFALAGRSCGSPSVLAGAALRLTRPARLRELLHWADVTLVECPWQFEYCRREGPAGPLVLASHNVERLRFASYAEMDGASGTLQRWLRSIERVEARALERADLVLAVSRADRDDFIHYYGVDPARVVEIPNGADTEAYTSVDRETKAAAKQRLRLPDRPTVIYTAADTPPNRAGLDWVRRLAACTSRFSFLVVGPISRSEVRGNLVATGLVDDIRPYLQAADIGLCPIEFGGGTKVKLFESLAAGLPSVAFAEATRGTAFRHGEHLLVAEKSERGLLAALDRLADDPELADRLGRAGRRLVAERHDWRRIAETLESALLELVSGRRRRLAVGSHSGAPVEPTAAPTPSGR